MFNDLQINCPFNLGTNLVISSPSKSGKTLCAYKMMETENNSIIIDKNNYKNKENYNCDLLIIDDFDLMLTDIRFDVFFENVKEINENPHIIILGRGMKKEIDLITKFMRRIFDKRPCIGVVFDKSPLKYHFSFSNGEIGFLGEGCLRKSSYKNVVDRCTNVIDILGSARNSNIMLFKGPENSEDTLFHIPDIKLCEELEKMFIKDRGEENKYHFSSKISKSYDTIVFTDIESIYNDRHRLFECSKNNIVFTDNKNHRLLPLMFLTE